nr:MAG TPA: hypothetical protein [Microviridae sp.]
MLKWFKRLSLKKIAVVVVVVLVVLFALPVDLTSLIGVI